MSIEILPRGEWCGPSERSDFRVAIMASPSGRDRDEWSCVIPSFAADEIERLQACERALRIAETALLDIKLSTRQRNIDEQADRALTAITAAKGGMGE